MSLSGDIEAALKANEDLMALLAGGVHSGVSEVSRRKTPTAFDENSELKPCALVKLGTETRIGPYQVGVQTPITVYFYQRDGFDVIVPAMDMTLALLHRKKVGTQTWEITYESTVNDQRDQALDCPLATMRFVAVRRR